MTPARQRRVDRSGNREYIASHFVGEPSSNQRTRAHGCFDDQYATHESSNQPVSLWEIGWPGRPAKRPFAPDSPVLRNFLRDPVLQQLITETLAHSAYR